MIFAKKENIKFFRVKLNHRPEPVRIFGRIALMMTRRMGTGSVLLQASRSVRLLSVWSVKLAPNPDSRQR